MLEARAMCQDVLGAMVYQRVPRSARETQGRTRSKCMEMNGKEFVTGSVSEL